MGECASGYCLGMNRSQLQNFSLGVYLLVTDGINASYCYNNYNAQYVYFYDFAETSYTLESPIGARVKTSSSPVIYTRNFTCGSVSVNLTSGETTINYTAGCNQNTTATPTTLSTTKSPANIAVTTTTPQNPIASTVNPTITISNAIITPSSINTPNQQVSNTPVPTQKSDISVTPAQNSFFETIFRDKKEIYKSDANNQPINDSVIIIFSTIGLAILSSSIYLLYKYRKRLRDIIKR